MSDEQGQTEDGSGQEPSMEDILASIRRILSEDEEEGGEEVVAAAPEPEPEAEPEPAPASPPPPPMPEAVPDDILELTADMITPAESVVSGMTSQTSTDALSELARAILDRRDISVGPRDVTLEGMIREMLRPMLKEWLDRNLPYLIERLVKKEIDHMINRAERLED
jgi:cell pole-organizing protein PopZ